MADPKAVVDPVEPKPDEIKPDDPGLTDPDPTKADETKGDETPKGIEITRESKGSLPAGNNFGVRKRINDLNAKVDKANRGRDQVAEDLEMEKKKNEILQLRIDQGSAYSKPNPDNYDGGSYDPKFEEDSAKHKIKEEVQRQVAESTKDIRQQTESERADANLRRSQETYYTQADGLEVSDFSNTESTALDILGLDATNAIINNFTKDSHLLMYFFGKNKADAEHFRGLWDTNKIQAVAEIGGILAELKVSPKTATAPAPDPDEELEGGSSSKVEMLQRKYDKLVTLKTENPGDQTIYPKMIQLKREMQKAG